MRRWRLMVLVLSMLGLASASGAVLVGATAAPGLRIDSVSGPVAYDTDGTVTVLGQGFLPGVDISLSVDPTYDADGQAGQIVYSVTRVSSRELRVDLHTPGQLCACTYGVDVTATNPGGRSVTAVNALQVSLVPFLMTEPAVLPQGEIVRLRPGCIRCDGGLSSVESTDRDLRVIATREELAARTFKVVVAPDATVGDHTLVVTFPNQFRAEIVLPVVEGVGDLPDSAVDIVPLGNPSRGVRVEVQPDSDSDTIEYLRITLPPGVTASSIDGPLECADGTPIVCARDALLDAPASFTVFFAPGPKPRNGVVKAEIASYGRASIATDNVDLALVRLRR